MGLLIYVYREPGAQDCTNRGISSRYTRLCLMNASGPFEPREDCPPVLLESHVRGCLRIVPAVCVLRGGSRTYVRMPGSWMMGGNFAATSDSRFSDACERLLGHRFYGAVSIHDRQE